jgi:hypothetical protein
MGLQDALQSLCKVEQEKIVCENSTKIVQGRGRNFDGRRNPFENSRNGSEPEQGGFAAALTPSSFHLHCLIFPLLFEFLSSEPREN